jgi:class 3 adenylate cyclase
VLATLMFTDIVGSSELAEELGDRRWRELLARHHAVIRRELKRFNGRELDTAGDGFFAAFTRPAEAVRCAAAVVDGVRELGIEIRSACTSVRPRSSARS